MPPDDTTELVVDRLIESNLHVEVPADVKMKASINDDGIEQFIQGPELEKFIRAWLPSYLNRLDPKGQQYAQARYRFVVKSVDNTGYWEGPHIELQMVPLDTEKAVEVDAPADDEYLQKYYGGKMPWRIFKKPKDAIYAIPKKPEWGYRGMAWEEWQQIRDKGVIASREVYNIGDDEKGCTLFADTPDSAMSYANSFAPDFYKVGVRRPAVIIAVPKSLLTYQNGQSGYMTHRGPISSDQLQAAWMLRPKHVGSKPPTIYIAFPLYKDKDAATNFVGDFHASPEQYKSAGGGGGEGIGGDVYLMDMPAAEMAKAKAAAAPKTAESVVDQMIETKLVTDFDKDEIIKQVIKDTDSPYFDSIRDVAEEQLGYDKTAGSEPDAKALAELTDQLVQQDMSDRYDRCVDDLSYLGEQIPVWRIINVVGDSPKQIRQNIKLDKVGVYWTWDEDAATEAYWGGDGQSVKLSGMVGRDQVDWGRTLLCNMEPSIGEEEKELRLLPGQTLKVISFEVDGKMYKMNKDAVTEAVVDDDGDVLDYLVDPSPRDVRDMARHLDHGRLRYFVHDGKSYWWNANKMTHDQFAVRFFNFDMKKWNSDALEFCGYLNFNYATQTAWMTAPDGCLSDPTVRAVFDSSWIEPSTVNGKVREQAVGMHSAGNGEEFWSGSQGAAGVLPVCPSTGRIGLAWRSASVHQGDCWGTIGGAVEEDETPEQTIRTELSEEIGYDGQIELHPAYVFKSGSFVYRNFIGVVAEEFELTAESWETDRLAWFDLNRIEQMLTDRSEPFHPGLTDLILNSRDLIEQLVTGKTEAKRKPKKPTGPTVHVTSATPDDFAARTEMVFIILNDGRLIEGSDSNHIDLLLSGAAGRNFDSSEEAAAWSDRNRRNAGFLLKDGRIVLWGKPDKQDIDLLVEHYGATDIRYWAGNESVAMVVDRLIEAEPPRTHLVHNPLVAMVTTKGMIDIDPSIPRFSKRLGGKRGVDIHRALWIHEFVEAVGIATGLTQPKAHLKALRAEHRYVRSRGFTPRRYEKVLEPFIKAVDKHRYKLPADTLPAQRPVIDQDEPELLKGEAVTSSIVDHLIEADLSHLGDAFYVSPDGEFVKVDFHNDEAKRLVRKYKVPLIGDGYPMLSLMKAGWASVRIGEVFTTPTTLSIRFHRLSDKLHDALLDYAMTKMAAGLTVRLEIGPRRTGTVLSYPPGEEKQLERQMRFAIDYVATDDDYKKAMAESRVIRMPAPRWSRRQDAVEVYVNPTAPDLSVLAGEDHTVRAFLVGARMYAWVETIHQAVRDQLKLPIDSIPLNMGVDADGSILWTQVTDNSNRGKWHHNPKVAAAIKGHPMIRLMADPKALKAKRTSVDGYDGFVSYYDEDVVGDWEKLTGVSLETDWPGYDPRLSFYWEEGSRGDLRYCITGMPPKVLAAVRRVANKVDKTSMYEAITQIDYQIDPSASKLLSMLRGAEYKALRGWVDVDGTTYWWDGSEAIHITFAGQVLHKDRYDYDYDPTVEILTGLDGKAYVKCDQALIRRSELLAKLVKTDGFAWLMETTETRLVTRDDGSLTTELEDSDYAVDPTPREIRMRLLDSEEGELRLIVDDGSAYWWDAFHKAHAQFASEVLHHDIPVAQCGSLRRLPLSDQPFGSPPYPKRTAVQSAWLSICDDAMLSVPSIKRLAAESWVTQTLPADESIAGQPCHPQPGTFLKQWTFPEQFIDQLIAAPKMRADGYLYGQTEASRPIREFIEDDIESMIMAHDLTSLQAAYEWCFDDRSHGFEQIATVAPEVWAEMYDCRPSEMPFPLSTDSNEIVRFLGAVCDRAEQTDETVEVVDRLVEDAAMPMEMEDAVYYHATAVTKYGEAILTGGTIKASNPEGRKTQTAPVVGRTYVSKDLWIVTVYSLGGVLISDDPWTGDFNNPELGRYGYIFEVPASRLSDVQPDEDQIGELIWKDSIKKAKAPFWLLQLFVAVVSPGRRAKVLDGEISYWASVGKQLLRRMSDDHKTEILRLVSNVANKGELKWTRAWRLDKAKSKDVKADGSNVLDIAELVATSNPTESSESAALLIDRMIERYGGAEQNRQIWYHGTKSKNLKSILSQGLIPDPKERAWNDDPDANSQSASRASYGGIYVTQNLMTAIGASTNRGYQRGDSQVIVCMELQSRSLAADEDDIALIVNHPITGENVIDSQYTVTFFYWRGLKDQNDKYYQQSLADSVKQWYARLTYTREGRTPRKIDAAKERRIKDLLAELYPICLRRYVSYFEKEMGQYWHSEWHANYTRATDDEGLPPSQPPDSGAAEADFRAVVDKLTKVLREEDFTDKFNHAGRSLEPIGFSGVNHIVAIAVIHNMTDEEKERTGHYNEVEVVYGTLPDDFRKQWKEREGEFYEWKGKKTTEGLRYLRFLDDDAYVTNGWPPSLDEAGKGWFDSQTGRAFWWGVDDMGEPHHEDTISDLIERNAPSSMNTDFHWAVHNGWVSFAFVEQDVLSVSGWNEKALAAFAKAWPSKLRPVATLIELFGNDNVSVGYSKEPIKQFASKPVLEKPAADEARQYDLTMNTTQIVDAVIEAKPKRSGRRMQDCIREIDPRHIDFNQMGWYDPHNNFAWVWSAEDRMQVPTHDEAAQVLLSKKTDSAFVQHGWIEAMLGEGWVRFDTSEERNFIHGVSLDSEKKLCRLWPNELVHVEEGCPPHNFYWEGKAKLFAQGGWNAKQDRFGGGEDPPPLRPDERDESVSPFVLTDPDRQQILERLYEEDDGDNRGPSLRAVLTTKHLYAASAYNTTHHLMMRTMSSEEQQSVIASLIIELVGPDQLKLLIIAPSKHKEPHRYRPYDSVDEGAVMSHPLIEAIRFDDYELVPREMVEAKAEDSPLLIDPDRSDIFDRLAPSERIYCMRSVLTAKHLYAADGYEWTHDEIHHALPTNDRNGIADLLLRQTGAERLELQLLDQDMNDQIAKHPSIRRLRFDSTKRVDHPDESMRTVDNLIEQVVKLDDRIFDEVDHLRPEIRAVLLRVATDVLADLAAKGFGVQPTFVVMAGSLLGPNYDDVSDMDLHIGINFEAAGHEVDLLKNYYALYARQFNAKDFTVRDRKLEIYFQAVGEPNDSPGIYDLLGDHWAKPPDNVKVIIDDEIKRAADTYLHQVETLAEEFASESPVGDAAVAFLQKPVLLFQSIRTMRKEGFAQQGQYGQANTLFKQLRRNNCLEKLTGLIRDVQHSIYGIDK